jgi:hypothetical protein
MEFSYKIVNEKGKKAEGQISAISDTHARQLLASKGWKILELQQQTQPLPTNAQIGIQLQPWVKYAGALGALAAIACLLLLRSSPGEIAVASATPSAVKPKKTIKITGILPSEPIESIHLCCPDQTLQLDCPASQLGQAGQPFTWEVELPAEAQQFDLEISRNGRRWAIAHGQPDGKAALVLPPLQLPTLQTQSADRQPFVAVGPSAKTSRRPTKEDRMRAHLERQKRLKELEVKHNRGHVRQPK